jgi:hypothetical protein
MTIRMLIERQKLRIMVVALLGFAIGAAGVILAQLKVLNVEPRFAVLPGGALFTLALLYANLFAFRCPRCGGRWEALAMGRGSFFALDRSLRYCPFCGADIDAEL